MQITRMVQWKSYGKNFKFVSPDMNNNFVSGKLKNIRVPEVLNVHMNESKKNLLFLKWFFFQAVKN